MTILAGKKGLIMGVANNRSIAWGIAEEAHKYGAELAFTFQGEALQKRVEPLAQSIGSNIVLPCDVTDQESINQVFEVLEKKWGKLDFLVHAIAYSDKEELRGKYLNTSPQNFINTMNISAFSLVLVSKGAEKLMINAGGGSIITLSYYGAEKVMPHYNVMGVAKAALESTSRYLARDLGAENIRVNLVAAGPIRTMAAKSIPGFDEFEKVWNERSPLEWDVTDPVPAAQAAVALLSDWFPKTTGEIVHVDGGLHAMGA